MRIISLLLVWLSLSASALSQNLVAYYPFNGNANDESGNGNNGTVNGAILSTDRFGNANNAYSFNGANNFISVADNPELFSDELTLSWWYKVPEYSGTRVVIGWVNGGNRYQQFFSGNSLAYFNGYYNSCCCFNPTYINMTAVNQWQHVAVAYKKTNTNESVTRLYINGELKQTDNHAAAITYQPGATFFIGKTHDGGYFNGELDDIRIYNNAMTDAQVQQLYNAESTGMVAYYPFNGNANDESGNGNHGTVNGASLTTDRFSNSNSAYAFNGTSDYINVPDAAILRPGLEISLSAWVKRTRFAVDIIIEKGGDWTGGTCNYGLGLHSVNNNMFYFFFNGGWRGTDGVNDLNWHHYAVVAKNGEANPVLYIDGLPKPVMHTSGGGTILMNNSAQDLHIGAQVAYSVYGANLIDEVRIYNRALSNAQVMSIYSDFPLPITLLNFQGRKLNATTAKLTWQTATEMNNKGFEVQRSFDGNYYVDIQFVNGAGNSNDIKDYSFTDVPGRTGRVFYRLKQVDFNGNSKLSNIVSVLFGRQGIIKVYPNPAQQQVTVEGIDNYNRVQVLDATGKLVKEQYSNGQYQVSINLNGLKSGIYLLRLANEKESQTFKLIISN